MVDEGLITVSFNGDKSSLSLQVMSTGGKIFPAYVKEIRTDKASANFSFRRSDLPDGVYLLVVKNGEKIIGTCKVTVVK